VGKSYVITSVAHSESVASYTTGISEGEVSYTNRFTCVPDDVVIRPQRLTPRPTIQGSQTAVLVGPPGEEIWPDEFGRVKVQFHWDREGQKDDKSSCWIRCQQPSAGRNWGTMSIPRVGQEVVVSYLEGDPDRPLITGVVYNADQMPAYELPSEKTKSYTKTNSSSGGEGHNEIRFEDKAGEEQVYVHAERNMDVRVKQDSMERMVGDRHQIIGTDEDGKSGDQIELVWQDHHLDVKRDQIEHIEGNRQLMVGNGDAAGGGNLDVVVANQEARSVGMGGYHLDVEGDRRVKVGMNCSTDVSVNCDHKVGMNYGVEATNVHVKAGLNAVIEAGLSLTLKVGGNFVNISPAGVSIVGTMVMINSGGAAGAGAGCSPQSPTAPAEAAPREPDEADDSESGQKSC